MKVLARQPPPVSSRRLLVKSLGVGVVDFRCCAHSPEDSPEEPNPTHSIVLVRRGVFRRTYRGDSIVADANHVLFFNSAQPYRYGHPVAGGDHCTILAIETDRALELVSHYAPREAEIPETPFLRGHAPVSRRALMLHWELLHLVATGGTSIATQDALAELADEAVVCAYGAPRLREQCTGTARRRRRELVEETKLMIGEELGAPPSLTALAEALACSPFHLSHTFRRVAGVSLRRYAQRLRLRAAADRLASGARSLTALALELGYADHSHFTNAFRREWGLTPSAFRQRVEHPPCDYGGGKPD